MRGTPHRRCLLVAGLLWAMLAAAVAGAAEAKPRLVRSCPGGKLYQLGTHRLLLLSGTP